MTQHWIFIHLTHHCWIKVLIALKMSDPKLLNSTVYCNTIYLFILINTVPFYLSMTLGKKYHRSQKILSSTSVFNIDYINQHVRRISEGSCDNNILMCNNISQKKKFPVFFQRSNKCSRDEQNILLLTDPKIMHLCIHIHTNKNYY